MTRERKRGLSLILAILMLFVTFSGSLGTAAYAEEVKTEEAAPAVEEAPKAEEAAPAEAPAEEKAEEEPEVVVDVAVLGEDKAEDGKEEAPVEEAKEEEKKEEAKPEAGEKKLTLAEQLDPKRKITVEAKWDGEELYFGDTATLKATLSGYDNAVYTIKWQTSKDGKDWEDIKGAEGAELKVTVTEENYLNYWRALVVVTAIKAA